MSIQRLDKSNDSNDIDIKKTEEKPLNKYSQQEKAIASLAYIGPLFVVPFFVGQQTEFTQFHGQQGFKVFLVESLLIVTSWFPVIGPLAWYLNIMLFLAAAGYGIFSVWKEEQRQLPYLDQINI
ncbi:MAG: hypothetical protein U9Q15_01515 [Patescibacteria group bacterium]|nr:hypothetical protein [Patescibacteria group bacterium]